MSIFTTRATHTHTQRHRHGSHTHPTAPRLLTVAQVTRKQVKQRKAFPPAADGTGNPSGSAADGLGAPAAAAGIDPVKWWQLLPVSQKGRRILLRMYGPLLNAPS